MGNQQRNSSKDLGWLGGFIDGEGSLMVIQTWQQYQKKDGSRSVKFDPAIKISGTEQSGLDHLTAILERAELPHHIYWRHPKNGLNKSSWMVEVKGMKRCLRWTSVLRNCLVIKRKEADAMFEYCESRLNQAPCVGVHKPPYTERQLGLIQSLRGRRKGTRLC